ncbi:MAG: PilZ domain-containing protein [Rhizorhabdus sp.]|uniref:PilZ domain-containing protein n=1 Tax=Rhizorhabdus sp. TaxID=1968843 RepID=UPI001B527153|nr:PilZ domain-containing protein [Rhizorhabdus sp.]MBP8232928.1 PilZ domain-containing protein [Rhizorhabdus sp.]
MSSMPHSDSRRRDERHVTTFKVARICGAQGEALCIIRNFSARGARIETNFPVDPGERLELQFQSDASMASTVRWSADGRAGVEFDAPVDPADLLGGAAEPLHRSRPPRFNVRGGGWLIAADDQSRVFVENISLAGVGLGLAEPMRLSAGDVVELALEGLGRFTATVRWATSERLRLKFCSPVYFRRLAAWLGAGAAHSSRAASHGMMP